MTDPAVPEWFTTREVADMFCVSVPTIRSWRTPAYKDSPLRLVGERTAHNQYRYSLDALDAFVERNPRFHPLLAHTLRRGTPLFPMALRGYTPPPADTPVDHQAWATLHEELHPDQPQG